MKNFEEALEAAIAENMGEIIRMSPARTYEYAKHDMRRGALWAWRFLMETVDGLSMAEKVAASVGLKRGVERMEPKLVDLERRLQIASNAVANMECKCNSPLLCYRCETLAKVQGLAK